MKNYNLIEWLWKTDSHEKQSPQRFVRYAAMLLTLLTLGVGQMWANYSKFRGNIYYNNSSSNWSYVSLVVGKDDYSCAYLFSHLSNTKLYYKWVDYSDWNDCYFFNENWGASNCEGTKPYDRVKNKTRWQPYKKNYDTGDRLYFNGTDASSAAGDLPLYTATLKVKKSTDGGAYTTITSGSWPATLNLKGTYMDGNAATGQNNFNTSSGDKAKYDDIPVTGEVTMTLGASADSKYEFVGWGTGDSPSDATSPKTYNITGATTYYAFFRTKEYTIAYSGGTNAESGSHANDTKYYGTSLTLPDAVFTRAGYAQTGWATSDGGAQAYALGGTYTANSATTLYPVWTAEVTHDVTVYYKCNGNLIGDESDTESGVGVTTTRNVTAPTIYGYTFSSWTLGSGIVNRTAGSSTTTNPIVINTNATDDYVLTANYTEVLTTSWKLIGDNATNSPFGDNYSYASGKAMSKKSGASATDKAYKTLDITKTGTWGFKVATASGNSYTYGWGTGDGAYITFNRSKSGNQQDVYTGEQHELKFNPDGLGEYEFEIDYTAAKCSVKVTFPTVYAVTFGKGTGGSSVTAKYSNVSFTSGTKVQRGKTVTFTQYASTGYQFKEWNTNSSGTGTQLSTSATYDHTVGTTNNVYAIYNLKQYTITLNDQDATTAVSPSTVNATYNSLTLSSSITNPLKSGYTFGGWYSATGGGGYEIINTSGALQASKSGYTNATGWTKTTAAELYAKWTQVLTLNGNGTGSTDGSLTVIYKKTATSSHTAATRTGYTLKGYYDAESGGNKIINSDGSLVSYSASVSSYIRTDGSWGYNGTPTLYAQWTANSYDVTLKPNGATTGSDQVVRATFDADMPTTTKTSGDLVAPTKTGYTFGGYSQNSTGSGTLYYTSGLASNHAWDQASNVDIYAKWTANEYTVSLDVDEANKGSIDGATASVTPTYDATMPSIGGTLPTAANGYRYMGMYTNQNGEGVALTDSLNGWKSNVDGYISDGKWVYANNTTLYAYYKKAEITALTFDAGTVEPEATVGVTPTISPTPTGTTTICWKILHSNDTPLDPQPTDMTYSDGKLTFSASAYSGTYKVQAILRKGSGCEGAEQDTETASFLVAGSHSVTVNYKCSSEVIKTATSVIGRPTEWSDDITAPDIFGYTFSCWSSADGVTIKDSENEDVTSSNDATIKIKATYAGSLTANYTQKQLIYFKNTLGWSNVYVNFYSSSYWNNPKGSGNQSVTKRNLAMTQYGETDIWYYDYGAASISPSLYVSFTSDSQDNTQYFWKSGGVNVVYPANYPDAINTDKSSENGFKAATPMFVPLATQDKVTLNQSSGGKADYYNAGYWTKYTSGTGYTLEIYNSAGNSLIKSAEFTSADELMPMKATVDLEGGTTYKFQLKRSGDIYYGNSGTMTYANHGDPTPWDMTNGSFSMCGITTNAAGDYTFNLSYSGNSSTPPHYRLRIAVDYPVADGDYRLIYKDAVHTNWHPSAIVSKANDRKDTVSFFVRPGSSPEMKIQTATVNPSTGAVSWGSDVSISSSTLTGLASTDVYNFNLSMDGSGNISLESVDTYTGNFYIRTDAANSKWDNYRSDPDHLMVYSEYSIDHGGYTHYHAHWVNKDDAGRKNVKFTIANDYSPCISDTLTRETASGTWANIASFITEGGDLLRSANVRFMWDKRDNSISRAYVDGAQEDGSEFLTIQSSDSKIKNAAGDATLTQVTFSDNGNWMYEANIKAQPTAQIKLLSKWGESNIITQYFRGGAESTETLIGGSGSNWYDIRLIYDFKTNRLIAGLIPSGTIDDQMAIHADVMFIREHHGDIAQLTFAEKDSKMGAITDIETAFGVLQFNKWTINNKSKADGHAPLSPLLSRFERDLFYVSFPFRVSMEDVFGFGTYGQHWIIEEYDGASRAANGYWLESGPNWKFVWNRKDKFFEPGQGYIIALELDEMGESSDVWANTDRVELYFPSYGTMPDITKDEATYNIPSHECTINWCEQYGLTDPNYDRRVKDSHWNVLGVPTYVNPDAPYFANTAWTTTATETSIGPNFLYEWNMTDNSVSAVSASGYTYHAMHAYLVQYCGDVTWTSSVSVTPPAGIAARRMSAERPQSVEFRLEMLQNDVMVDQTYIKLSDDEHVTTGFEFNYDMSKEFNKSKANIYTLIGTEPAAGNVLPLTEQATVVPVGVKIATTGDYTFSMPDGTEGIGITLIDNETGIRTSLSALDYTINLSAGEYTNRFFLEISPIKPIATGVEQSQMTNHQSPIKKVLVDGLLYIVKDGKMYDARGAVVK